MSRRKTIPISFIIAVFLNACASIPQKSNNFLLPDNYELNPPAEISADQMRSDIKHLEHFIKNGYGGRKYVEKIQIQNAIEMLNSIVASDGKINTTEFCKNIDEALMAINDAHLIARINNQVCSSRRKSKRKSAFIGKNINQSENQPWIKKDIYINKKRISVLAISTFPLNESKSWNGFLNSVADAKDNSAGIIIDLRGNGGGDDSMGLAMVDYLYGQDHVSNLTYKVVSKTPETLSMWYNNYQLMILKTNAKKEPLPDYLIKRRDEVMQNLKKSLETNVDEEKKLIPSGPPFDANKAFTKPILVLIDNQCASSCESIVGALEAHPKVITLGDNTGGFVHFGNMGNVILPSSKIIVQMATEFKVFKDNRFIENIGYTPAIRLTDGQDGLDAALKTIGFLVKNESLIEQYLNPLQITLGTNNEHEKTAKKLIEGFAKAHDMSKYYFTKKVHVQSYLIPHSHPILTLNTRQIDDPDRYLALFLHEQIHWMLDAEKRKEKVNNFIKKMKIKFPTVPSQELGGASDAESTYLHLAVCFYELEELTKLIGKEKAEKVFSTENIYSWVRKQILQNRVSIEKALRDSGLEWEYAK